MTDIELTVRAKGLAFILLSVLKFGYVLDGKPSSSNSPLAVFLWDPEVCPAAHVCQAYFSHIVHCSFSDVGGIHNEAQRFIG